VTDDDDGRPSFADVVKAVTPPGTDWDEFKAAMRQAHQTGGHQPGRIAPDISVGGSEALRQYLAGGAGPADPFASMTPGAVAATAMHEAFQDLLAGGFTEDQALTFLARAYAAANGPTDG
jgi:hypothetical protein